MAANPSSTSEDIDIEGCVTSTHDFCSSRARVTRRKKSCANPLYVRFLHVSRCIVLIFAPPSFVLSFHCTPLLSIDDNRSLTSRLVAATDAAEPRGRAFLQQLLEQAARFCFGHSFSRVQIESFCGIIQAVIAEDVASWQRGSRGSFDDLKRRLLEVTVDRPPKAVPLFTPLQATLGVDFMLKTYYANYKLYKYCLSRVPIPDLEQSVSGGAEPVRVPPPLSEAVLVGGQK
jgi:hypothetical protein